MTRARKRDSRSCQCAALPGSSQARARKAATAAPWESASANGDLGVLPSVRTIPPPCDLCGSLASRHPCCDYPPGRVRGPERIRPAPWSSAPSSQASAPLHACLSSSASPRSPRSASTTRNQEVASAMSGRSGSTWSANMRETRPNSAGNRPGSPARPASRTRTRTPQGPAGHRSRARGGACQHAHVGRALVRRPLGWAGHPALNHRRRPPDRRSRAWLRRAAECRLSAWAMRAPAP